MTRLRTSNLEPDSNFEDEGVGELSVEEKYAEVKQLIAIGKDAEATLLEQFEPWEGQWLKSALHRIGSVMPTVSPEATERN